MGTHTVSPELPGNFTANSTTSPFSLVCTLASYCPGARNCSKSILSCTSPTPPRILTLLKTFLRPPTSCARVCISPSPFCTSNSCFPTVSKLFPILSVSVLSSFSSTVCLIFSNFSLVSSTIFVWVLSRVCSFSLCMSSKDLSLCS